MVKSQASRPALAGAGSAMSEAADADGASKELVPEGSEKPQDAQAKHRRRSVLRVSQLLLRAIAAHKGLTLPELKKEFGNAGYQVRRKSSRHSAEMSKAASVRGTLLRVSGSKAEGYFRVWKSMKPIKKPKKKSPSETEAARQKSLDSLFPRRYKKPPDEASQPKPWDSLQLEVPDVSETPHTSTEKINVEQVDENSEDLEEVAPSLAPRFSPEKTREEVGHQAKQQKLKKMKMKMKMEEKLKNQMTSAEGSKRSKTKKEKQMKITEDRRPKAKEDKTRKSKKTKEKGREREGDPERRVKSKQSPQNHCRRHRNLSSAMSSKIHAGHGKALDPRARRPYKAPPRKDSSRKESAQRIGGHP